MATKLGLYKAACLALRHAPIDTLTDEEVIRHRLDDCYDRVLEFMLEQGAWNFAKRTVSLDSSEDEIPEFGFQYAFDKPEDWVRTLAIASNERMWPPLGPDEFDDEGAMWYADCDPLYLCYVSNGVSYGLDLSGWPETFARAVELELAYRVAPHVTSMGEDSLDQLEKRKFRALKDARSKDALNQASKRPPPGRLTMSRGGSMRRGYFGTRDD